MSMKAAFRRIVRRILNGSGLLRFALRERLVGFDHANQIIAGLDKTTLSIVLRRYGAVIGEGCDIETGQTFHNCLDYSNLHVGNGCHIGKNCFFDLRGRVEIGDHSVVSMQNTFITHMDAGNSRWSSLYPARNQDIRVGEHCYIGARSTILLGVTIGANSLVAAGSLVIRNVDPGSRVGGSPAGPLRMSPRNGKRRRNASAGRKTADP